MCFGLLKTVYCLVYTFVHPSWFGSDLASSLSLRPEVECPAGPFRLLLCLQAGTAGCLRSRAFCDEGKIVVSLQGLIRLP